MATMVSGTSSTAHTMIFVANDSCAGACKNRSTDQTPLPRTRIVPEVEQDTCVAHMRDSGGNVLPGWLTLYVYGSNQKPFDGVVPFSEQNRDFYFLLLLVA